MRVFLNSQFLLLSICFPALFIFILSGGKIYSKYLPIWVLFHTLTPAIVAYFFAKKENIRLSFFKKRGNKLLQAFLLALGIVALTIFFDLPFSQFRNPQSFGELIPGFFHKYSLPGQYVLFTIYWLTILAVFSLYQIIPFLSIEIMYSGYAWEKLKHLGFWQASWAIGLCLSLWSIPLVLMGMGYPNAPLLGILWSFLYAVLLTPIKIYLRLQSKSILTAAVFFCLITHFSNIFVYFFETTNFFLYGVQGLTGFTALVFINLILFLKTRKTPLLEYEL